ncbi:hypothetical protein INT46_010187 [Mucor plumbeus]|uniref:Uncharacterized protein n=1 Tax=Mucor plumbeus TaxID=97098 RepID=A0A8H7V0X2_9FUNG|nr:hypothetical protein INT46_010187 [Mucor plumbeus]
MDTIDEKKLKKLHASKTQRDKELERIKSLAVVSVLNKNFKETTPPPRRTSLLPTLSPSNSLTTDNHSTATQDIYSKSKSHSISRSQTVSYSSNNPIKKSSNSSLHSDYSNHLSQKPSFTTNRHSAIFTSSSVHEDDQKLPSERELDEGYLVTDSPIDTEKETLEKRVQELEALYTASMNDLQTLESQNNNQKEILVMQDRLIQQMADQLDTQENNNMQCQICSTDDVESLLKAQQDVVILTRELNELRPLKLEYSSAISDFTEKSTINDNKIEELEQLAREIQKANAIQTEFIDTKVQTLLDKILTKNKIINKLEHDQQEQLLQQLQYQQLPHTPKPDMISKSGSIQSLNDKSTVIWEKQGEEEEEKDDEGDDKELEPNSARSSYVSHEDQHRRKSYVSRWKGNSIPPASPPPSLPLPPIPSASSRSTSRPKSTLSEISRGSSIHAQHTSNKHISMDAVGGIGGAIEGGNRTEIAHRRPSIQSEFDEELADAAYYKEFTDQLQERLSISKEIDDLRVWEPSDYDSIQRKIDSKNWSDSEDGHSVSSSQKAAFWKGMKKKLKV